MAIIMNAKGTTSPYFKIGKQGTNIFQGSSDPASSYTTVEGDLWIDTSNKVIKFRNSSNNGWTQGTSSITGNLTVSGDLTINGTTTTLDTTNLLVEDPLLVLARSASGTPTLDAGLVIERGSSTNVGFIWDESADQFAVVNTTESGSTAGNVSIASYANIRANEFHGDGSNLTGITSGAVTALNNATVNELVTVGSTTTELDAQSGLTFSGSTLTVAGNVTMQGGSTSADFSFTDDVSAKFGTGNDLKIYHSNGHSYIYDEGDGYLVLMSGGPGIRLNSNTAEVMIDAVPDGAVTLYHNNSAKLATTSTGVSVTGTYTGTGLMTTGGNIVIPDSGTIGSASDTDAIYIGASGVTTFTQSSLFNNDITVKDDIYLDSDDAVIYFGDDNEITLTHVPDSGLRLADNMKMIFGTNDDLQIYHDGSSSIIRDVGTGNLALQAEDFAVQSADASATHIFVDADTGYISLGYGGSVKLATTSTGVSITGTYTGTGLMTTGGNIVIPNAGTIGSASDTDAMTISSSGVVTFSQKPLFLGDIHVENDVYMDSDDAVIYFGEDNEIPLRHVPDHGLRLDDNDKMMFGNSGDLQIYHNGAYSLLADIGTGNLVIAAEDLQLTNAGVTENYLRAYANGSVELYYDNGKKLETTAAGATITGALAVGDTASATLDIGSNLSTGSAKIEIGTGRSGNGYSYIDLVGDTTYTDYGLRIIRDNSGANAPTSINHRGTGTFTIKSTEASDILFQTTNASRMTIASGGNVGIGTTSPTQKLDVNGTINITGDATISGNLTVNGTTTILDTNVTSVDKLEIGASSTDYGARINQTSTGDILQLQDSGTTVVVVKDGGNVGIGTSSPTYKLDVAGTFRTTGDLTLAGGAVLGSGTLTGDGQNDIFLFSTGPTTGTAQSGAYHNKLRIVGGSSQTRDLQLYQVDSGYATIDSSWTSNQLTIGSAFTQVNFQQDIIPSAHNTYSLGQEANYFDNAYSHHYWSDAVQDRLKYGVWDEGAVYAMGMGGGYTLGALNDYAMTFQMNSDTDRGFWWGNSSHTNAQGAMSLTTGGHLYVAGSVRLGDGTGFTSGTISPTYKLDVNGAVNIGDGNQRLSISAGSGGAEINNKDNSHMRLSTNDTLRVHIGYDGLVGIGTGAPITDLHIVDATPQIRFEAGEGTNQYGQLYQSGGISYFMSRNGSSHGQIAFNTYNSSSNIERMRLTSLGRLGVGTASPAGMIGITAPSDTRAFHYNSNQTNVDTSMYAGYIDANMTFTGGSATGNRQGYGLYMDKDLTGTLGTTTTNNNRIYNVNLAVDTRTANSTGTVFEQRGIVNLGYVWPTGTGNVDRTYGILNYVYDYQPHNSLQTYGAINGVFKRDESTGTTGTIGGAINYCSKYANSGPVTTMYGSNNYVDVDGGNVTSAIALRSYVTGSGTGTIANAYGLYVNNYYTGGTITNSYGLYVDGFDKHYFEGKVGIGTTTPATALDVNSTDAIVIPKGTTAQRPGTPESGMVRFNTTTSCFEGYNGSSWINLGAYS